MKRSSHLCPGVALFALAFTLLGASLAEAQLRTSVPIRPSKADRPVSRLAREDGAIYLEDLVKQDLKARVIQAAPLYNSLQADRWLGNLFANQEVTVLAISERAFRVRGQAKQGQVAGWVGKGMIEGITEEMEANLGKLHERHVLVSDLIENRQVALGMTQGEVMDSLGTPSKRNAAVDKEGQTAEFEYTTFERVPQTTTAFDHFGRPFQTITYLEVETGNVKIGFEQGLVSRIEESEGVNLQNAAIRVVPPPIVLF